MQKTSTIIDIIIVNYNSTDYLLKCLESVYESLEGISANVLIQDNGSKDGVDRITDLFPNVILVQNSHNIGVCCRCKQGATDMFRSIHSFVKSRLFCS